MSKRKHKKHIEEAEEQPQEEEQEVPQEEEVAEPAEVPNETEAEQPASDDIFEIDTGKKGRGKSAIDLDKFKDLIDRVEAAMERLDGPVKIKLGEINKLLGTSVSNNNSFAYRLKTGRDTKPILTDHNLYVGSRGSWNGPVEEQRIAFVRTQ